MTDEPGESDRGAEQRGSAGPRGLGDFALELERLRREAAAAGHDALAYLIGIAADEARLRAGSRPA